MFGPSVDKMDSAQNQKSSNLIHWSYNDKNNDTQSETDIGDIR